MSRLFVNAKVILSDRIVDGGVAVSERDGKIEQVIEGVIAPERKNAYSEVTDCGGNYLSPGFIEMHSHGGGGYDFLDCTEEALIGACSMHIKHGTTSICPTTLSAPMEELKSIFRIYRSVKRNWTEGPELLGVHLEGPFFSPAQAGAQDPAFLSNPTKDKYMPILEAGGDDICRMSVAAELPGALELGKELRSRGIVAAIGHSNATYAEVCEAVENGYSLVTHLYSGMSSLHRVGPYRVLGVVESAYLLDELKVEIISDGKHLPPELLKLIVKCKGMENISLVTDSMRGAGMPEGSEPVLGSLQAGQKTLIRDGVAMMPDFKAFAGSVCTADRAVRTMVKQAGVSLQDAVRMMSLNPAEILKADRTKGSIAVGKDADLLIFNNDIEISSVYVKGRKLL